MPTQGTVVTSTLDAWAYNDRISATDARYALASLLMPIPGDTNISYRGGVFASGDDGNGGHQGLQVTPSVSGLSVDVAMGNCVIDTPSNGPYMATVDSRKSLPLAAPSSTQDRIDLVIARVYDDNNTAIGSPPNVRQFVVEVWTGDGAVSNPSPPIPTPTAGWIPLAEVYVPRNAASPGTITDRRGPGLVARGGMRMLFGNDATITSDAFAEAGAYPGDQRYVHGPGFQHQVYAGQTSDPLESGWRGVHNAMYYEKRVSSDFLLLDAGTTYTVAEIDIPYPGTPFRVRPAGRIYVVDSASNVSIDLFLEQRRNSDPSGVWGMINWNNANTYRGDLNGSEWNALWDYPMEVAPFAYGIFTEDIKVRMRVAIRDAQPGSGFQIDAAGGWLNLLQVEVIPAQAHNIFDVTPG